jgi:hypothetical protein
MTLDAFFITAVTPIRRAFHYEPLRLTPLPMPPFSLSDAFSDGFSPPSFRCCGFR